jgi:3D (Asp-Asp-Asp) domain-containing protein
VFVLDTVNLHLGNKVDVFMKQIINKINENKAGNQFPSLGDA